MTRYAPLWEAANTYPASLDRRLIAAIWSAAMVNGYAVTVAAGTMNMNIAAGTCVCPTANNTGSVLCYSDAVEVVTSATAPASGTNRIDLVVCQPRGNDLDGGTNNDFLFVVVTGTPAAPGAVVAPAVPAGAVALAQVLIVGGSASLVAGNLTDRRALSPAPAGLLAYSDDGTSATLVPVAPSTILLPNTTIAAAVPARRIIRVSASVQYGIAANVPSSGQMVLRLQDAGATVLQERWQSIVNAAATGMSAEISLERVIQPTLAQTYTFRLVTFTNTAGNVNTFAQRATITLEDLGGT